MFSFFAIYYLLLFFFIKRRYVNRITFISSAYIIAGIAILSSLKIKGDEAMAIACAAFCIPISIIMARRAAVLILNARDRSEPQDIVTMMSRAQAVPKVAMLSAMTSGYCKKNSSANSISAGKAALPNTRFVLSA